MSWVVEVNERRRLLEQRAARLSKADQDRVVEILSRAPIPVPGAGETQTIWSGEKAEICWQVLREAERALLEAEDRDAVAAIIPRLLARLSVLRAGDPRRTHLKTPLERIYNSWSSTGTITAADKHDVLAAFDEIYDASDDHHRDMRAYRNLLLGSAVALATAVVVVGVVHLIEPTFLGLCRGSGSARQCVNGASARGGDIFLLAALGALGGMVGAISPLSRSSTIRTRYNVRAAQVALKPAVGAAMAIVGVVLVQGVSTPSSAKIAGLAALFGVSQQAFTRAVDKNANALLGQPKQSKRPRKSQASVSAAPAPQP